MNKNLFYAAILGLSGVAEGALGAHAWGNELAARGMTDVWHTAVLYQLMHAVAILAIGLFSLACPDDKNRWLARAGNAWAPGVILFSGSLYWLALGGPHWLGPVTPLGGLLLILGWICVFAAAWETRTHSK